MVKTKRPRADAFPLRFKSPDLKRHHKSKKYLAEIIEKHAPYLARLGNRQYSTAKKGRETILVEFDSTDNRPTIDQVFERINTAFLNAELRVTYSRAEHSGPTIEDRRLLATYIAEHSRKLLFFLSSEQKPTRNSELGDTQFAMFHAVGQQRVASEAIKVLGRLQLAALRVLRLDDGRLGGDKQTKSQRGRPTDDALNILFGELMAAWKDITGERPRLSRNVDEGVTCRFCRFFHHYFGGYDPKLRVRAIADRCAKLQVTR